MKRFALLWMGFWMVCGDAQFAPAAGKSGSTAIKADSNCFVSWANSVQIIRGYRDISLTDSGLADVGDATSAIGKALTNGVVSLGDGGMATLYFESGMVNGPGFDFAVFENAFNDTFLELAHVEISQNGIDYFRFPSVSLTDTENQTGAFGATYPERIHNLAGKYRLPFGTPFDIDELTSLYDSLPETFYYVRVIDVVGSVDANWGSKDHLGNLINDPWPTPFPSSGFDLDAVGVIHPYHALKHRKMEPKAFQVFPRETEIEIRGKLPLGSVCVFDTGGRLVRRADVNDTCFTFSGIPAGLYWISVNERTERVFVP